MQRDPNLLGVQRVPPELVQGLQQGLELLELQRPVDQVSGIAPAPEGSAGSSNACGMWKPVETCHGGHVIQIDTGNLILWVNKQVILISDHVRCCDFDSQNHQKTETSGVELMAANHKLCCQASFLLVQCSTGQFPCLCRPFMNPPK